MGQVGPVGDPLLASSGPLMPFGEGAHPSPGRRAYADEIQWMVHVVQAQAQHSIHADVERRMMDGPPSDISVFATSCPFRPEGRRCRSCLRDAGLGAIVAVCRPSSTSGCVIGREAARCISMI